jgi:FtsP/CotA-like multicopper oxidase with cupredoxin domain
VTEVPGLYFLGLSWQHTRGSALIGWVKDDAEFVAGQIETSARGRESSARRVNERHSVRRAPLLRAEEADVEQETFPREITGLSEASSPEVIELEDGDEFDLRIEPVAKRIGDEIVRMLAYNSSIPGPTLKVREGSKLIVHVTNEGDLEATVHWHGLRLENRYDGTHETQAPIPVGETFTYEVSFPDPGAYWYHPHIREDYGQEMGLYGNILVAPPNPEYWPPTHRELALTLDDVLIEDGKVAAFSPKETTHVAMGRFGNVMLVSGDSQLELEAQRGEVVRFYLTNTANTRVFNVALPGAQMKLVGADSGHYEREEFVEHVLIAPSERVVVDVFFPEAGTRALEHQTPERTYRLATIAVGEEGAEPSLVDDFQRLRTNADMADERRRAERYLDSEPEKTLAFVAEMDLGTPEGPVVYACPMHLEVVSDEPGRCPKCGMTLLATAVPSHTTYACPMHPEVTSDAPDRCPKCGMKLIPAHLISESGHEHEHQHREHGHHEHGMAHHESHHEHVHEHAHDAAQGIEWEDDMVEVNRITTPANMRWKLVDRSTGAENAAIAWRFRVGDQVKIRLVNDMDSDHPMPHPFHIHGAGRFLILSRDGEPEPNLVWKDTVLVRTGESVDILLDVSNPGRWMAHCHIAEHHESGMMFSFDVDA